MFGSTWERLGAYGNYVRRLAASGSVWARLGASGRSGSVWQRLGMSGSVRERLEDASGTLWENALYVKIRGSRFIRKNTYSGPSGSPKIDFHAKFWARTKLSTPSLKLPKGKI